MTDPTPTQNQITPATDTSNKLPGPLRCFSGAVVSSAIAIALYFLTSSIAQTFASKPIQSDNMTVIKITIAVRTLVVGMSTLATCIFGLIAIGLLALGIQVAIQRLKNPPTPPKDA